MIKSDYAEYKRLADKFGVLPVYKEIYADLTTPTALLIKLKEKSERVFLLESVEGGEKWARWSFLGFEPKARLTYKNSKFTVTGEGSCEKLTDKPYEALREYMSEYRAPKLPGLPPFTGGLTGYFAYSMTAAAEPSLKLRESEFNDFDLMLFDKIIAYDHFRQKIIIIVNMKTDDFDPQYRKAVKDIEDIEELINAPFVPLPSPAPEMSGLRDTFGKEAYCKMVSKVKDYIFEGDIFQCVVSRCFEASYKGSLVSAYRTLRASNPSPYLVYLKADDSEIICSSPETLVKVTDRKVITYPIAGSRPRGRTPEEDERLLSELLKDEKELAEHNMLVDLGRNDVGKISELGTVKVTEYQKVNKFSRIMHICSEVEGKLRSDKDAFDALAALLPAGTLSGAPKLRACEIIEELEGTPRGIYGGAIGYVGFSGDIDAAIAIRMAVKKDGKVYIQAGAGIVADSVPETEYEETGHKAAAVLRALGAEGGVSE